MTDATLGARVAAVVRPFGLNLVGVASLAAYDALVPRRLRLAGRGGASALVLGHGGGAFWEVYRRHLDEHPAWAERAHPIDDFTRELFGTRLASDLRAIGIDGPWCFPFGDGTPRLSFAHLAEAAGLGVPSQLGVLVHPEFGPWIAFRGAVLLASVVEAARPARGFDPCGSCRERPCEAACPAAAVSPSGWSVTRCVGHRILRADVCPSQCDARVACVYGRAHRYPSEALAYHHRTAFALARRWHERTR